MGSGIMDYKAVAHQSDNNGEINTSVTNPMLRGVFKVSLSRMSQLNNKTNVELTPRGNMAKKLITCLQWNSFWLGFLLENIHKWT